MLLKGEEYLEADEIVDLTKQMICAVFAIFHYFFYHLLTFYYLLSFLSFVIILILFVIICTLLFM